MSARPRSLGLRRPFILAVPFLSPSLSSHWVRLVTRANWSVARELVLGLAHDLLAQDARYWGLIGHEQLLTFREAARRALAEDRTGSRMNGFERAIELRCRSSRRTPTRGRRCRRRRPQGVQSVQEVEVPMDAASFERWGQPGALRRLLEALLPDGGAEQRRVDAGTMDERRAHRRPALAGASADRHGRPDYRRATACDAPSACRSSAGWWPPDGGSARLAIVLARHGTTVRLSVELTATTRGRHASGPCRGSTGCRPGSMPAWASGSCDAARERGVEHRDA